jgi:hypothetical protein
MSAERSTCTTESCGRLIILARWISTGLAVTEDKLSGNETVMQDADGGQMDMP